MERGAPIKAGIARDEAEAIANHSRGVVRHFQAHVETSRRAAVAELREHIRQCAHQLALAARTAKQNILEELKPLVMGKAVDLAVADSLAATNMGTGVPASHSGEMPLPPPMCDYAKLPEDS